MNTKGTKRISLGVRKKFKRKNRRLVRSIVSYLNSDGYFFSPLFSNFPKLASSNSKSDKNSMAEFETWGIKKKRRISEKVKEYLKSDCHMYGSMISPLKLVSSVKGIKNVVTMEVSTSTTTIKEDNSYRNLRSEIAEQTLHNGRIKSPKQTLHLEGQRSRETNLSPAFSSLPEEKMVRPDQRRVAIE